MGSWRHNMPVGMVLRSRVRSSHIADPRFELGLDAWAAATGSSLSEPVPLESYLAYGDWFQRQAVPDVDNRRVARVSAGGSGFVLTLEDGEELSTSRVVVAAGIAPFAFQPPLFRELPEELIFHSAYVPDLARFAGRRVLVVGGGQSALETAALLAEAGADAKLVARAAGLVWLPPLGRTDARTRINQMITPPTDVGGRVSGWIAAIPGVARRVPARIRAWASQRALAPMGAHVLRARLEGVPLELQRTISSAEPGDDSVRVTYDDGAADEVDRVILCTGYRVEISRYGFLGDELLARIERRNGSPRLRPGLESSVPGLYFAGAPAASSFGPIMRFVVGTWYAAPAISRAIADTRQRPRYVSYRPRVPKRG
jgi:cation diffusion facilitator CzcD-associated flavoprotein CzcO